jgi:hypothetical protein
VKSWGGQIGASRSHRIVVMLVESHPDGLLTDLAALVPGRARPPLVARIDPGRLSAGTLEAIRNHPIRVTVCSEGMQSQI